MWKNNDKTLNLPWRQNCL